MSMNINHPTIIDASITNPEHWLNHSYVVLVDHPYTAGDAAAVANAIASIKGAGTADVTMEMRAGDQTVLKVKRMVREGRVAVMLRGGHRWEVSLPAETERLLPDDLQYISDQIDAVGKPLSPEEQKRFLNSANGPIEISLPQESPFLMTSFSQNSINS